MRLPRRPTRTWHLHSSAEGNADSGNRSTQEMTAGRMAAARFGGLNDGLSATSESPTIEQPLPGTGTVDGAPEGREGPAADPACSSMTAELAIDDLGLDLNSLDHRGSARAGRRCRCPDDGRGPG